jgi:hypothetical protein
LLIHRLLLHWLRLLALLVDWLLHWLLHRQQLIYWLLHRLLIHLPLLTLLLPCRLLRDLLLSHRGLIHWHLLLIDLLLHWLLHLPYRLPSHRWPTHQRRHHLPTPRWHTNLTALHKAVAVALVHTNLASEPHSLVSKAQILHTARPASHKSIRSRSGLKGSEMRKCEIARVEGRKRKLALQENSGGLEAELVVAVLRG